MWSAEQEVFQKTLSKCSGEPRATGAELVRWMALETTNANHTLFTCFDLSQHVSGSSMPDPTIHCSNIPSEQWSGGVFTLTRGLRMDQRKQLWWCQYRQVFGMQYNSDHDIKQTGCESHWTLELSSCQSRATTTKLSGQKSHNNSRSRSKLHCWEREKKNHRQVAL